jgi:prepilin-type N-terminal cleavage/methylation domain-containing protein
MRNSTRGFTLLELLIVLMILVTVAWVVIALAGDTSSWAQVQATNVSMQHLRDAIVGTVDMPGFLTDTGKLPTTLCDLFVMPGTMSAYDPNTRMGWRGPYIWNPPIVVHFDLVSNRLYYAGASGQVEDRVYLPFGFNPYYKDGDPVVLDAWGNPIVLQIPNQTDTAYARLVSAGPNGVIDTLPNVDIPPVGTCGDDRFLYLTRQDDRPLPLQ